MSEEQLAAVTALVEAWFIPGGPLDDVESIEGTGYYYPTLDRALRLQAFLGEYTGHEFILFNYIRSNGAVAVSEAT